MSPEKTGWLKRMDDRVMELAGIDATARFFRQHAVLLAYVFAAGVIAYATDIFTFSLNIDSENHAYGYGAKEAWVVQGRWGMYWLSRILLPDAIMPVIPTLLAVLGSTIGAVFFLKLLSAQRGLPDYLAAPIVIACPVIYFAFYFTTLGYGVGVAFATSAGGVYALTRWTWKGGIIAVLCFCFSIGIYQAVLPLLATLFCLYLVSSVLEEKNLTVKVFFLRVGGFFLALLVAAPIYQAISNWMLDYVQMEFQTDYMMGFISYQPTLAYFREAIEKTWPIAIDYYTGGQKYYLYDLLSLKCLFYVVLAVSLLRILTATASWPLRVLGVLTLGAALLAPMMMHLLNNGFMPPRTMLGISQVLGAMVFISASSRSKSIQLLTGALVLACYYNFSVVNNRYGFSNAMTWQADRELSVLILQRINAVLHKIPPKNDPFSQYPMEIVGWSEYLPSPIFVNREVIGSSFYTWGAGDVNRTERLFRTMGVFDFRAATQQERLSVVEEARKMPSWPYEGSVDIIKGIIVIKFRDYNPNQFLVMCQPPMEKHEACLKYMPH